MQRWEELAYAKEEGRLEGSLLKLVSLVCKKIEKNKTPEEIAEDLEEEISVIEPIYHKVKESSMPYNPELLLEQLKGLRRISF